MSISNANYRSLTGGYFSKSPLDKTSGPTSIRCNNPGAVNGARWERNYPGYVDEVETTPGNRTTIFETPEQGIAAWWQLLKNYRSGGSTTIEQIINRYGGGQDYSNYLNYVVNQTNMKATFQIKLDDDTALLKLAKAMFKYEAGKKIPWSDAQIMFGIRLGRSYAKVAPAPTVPAPKAPPPVAEHTTVITALITAVLAGLAAVFELTPRIFVIIAIVAIIVAVIVFIWMKWKHRSEEPWTPSTSTGSEPSRGSENTQSPPLSSPPSGPSSSSG